MVLRHFQLREQPFGVTPDPRYLYASGTHREALSALVYGIESGLGFVALTANPGMGKTTLLFETLRRMGESTRTVFLFQTISSPEELLRALLIDLGEKEAQGTLVELQTRLNQVLVSQNAQGKRLVLAIDEAQNLNDSVLEAVRMLSNFETARQKLMQIILCGQLQLAEKLAEPQLLQLRQRVSIYAHLKPLSVTETAAYIQHRLRVAGYASDKPLFTSSAITAITHASAGIPRNINNICFNALTIGCALQRTTIDVDVIREVLADLHLDSAGKSANPVIEAAKKTGREGKIKTSTAPMLAKLRPALIGVAAILVLVFGWLVVLDYRAYYGNGAVEANASATPAPQKVPAVESKPQASAPVMAPVMVQSAALNPAIRKVTVRGGQSLYAICTENFGECHPDLFRLILKINPSIDDPDHIESGQKVSLPVLPASPADHK